MVPAQGGVAGRVARRPSRPEEYWVPILGPEPLVVPAKARPASRRRGFVRSLVGQTEDRLKEAWHFKPTAPREKEEGRRGQMRAVCLSCLRRGVRLHFPCEHLVFSRQFEQARTGSLIDDAGGEDSVTRGAG